MDARTAERVGPGTAQDCDLAEANRFLIALDHKAAHHTFQTFDDNADRKDQKLASVANGTLQKSWNHLASLSDKGAGVFVTINETNLKGREAADILRVRALFVDLDGASLDGVLNDTEVPKPHIIVESSRGNWHVYWLVLNVPLGAFRALQKFLIHRFGGDKVVHDLPRVLRLPGFPHQKIKKGIVSPPFLSRIESISKAAPYDGGVFSTLLASAPLFDSDTNDTDDGPTAEVDDSATDEAKVAVIKSNYVDVDKEKVLAALAAVTADCSYDDWRDIGAVIRHSGFGIEVFNNWSATAEGNYTERSTTTQWKACRNMWRIGPGTLYRFADQQHPEWRNELDQQQLDKAIALIVAASAEYREARASDNINTQPDETDIDDDIDDDDLTEEIIGNISWPAPADLWGQLDPPELPRGLLPPIIEQLALVEGEHMGCDPAGLAISALVVCAAAIPDQVTMLVKKHNDDWMECARLWSFLVGPPSTKKTPIINRATWPLKQIDTDLFREYSAAMIVYEALPKEEQALQTPPRQRRVRIEDTTIEAAQHVFADSREGLLCLQDELSGFFGMLDRYSGGSSKDRSFWLQAYNGGSYLVNRIRRGAIHIENLSACLLGGVQPDVIRKLAGEGVDDGLMQRAMPVILRTATIGTDEPHDMVNIRYGNLVKRLHQMEIPSQPLVFSAAAQVIRRELEAKHMKLQASEAINKQLAGTVGKYDGLFVRLCLTFQCIENMDAEHFQMTVSDATARRVATFLHQFLFGHACCFYLGMLSKADDQDRLSKVALFILAKRLGKIDNRSIQRGNRVMRNCSKRDTEDLLDQLDTFGWIVRIKDTKGKVTNLVNPRVHALFAERGKREEERIKDAREMIAESVKLRRKT
jgi:hypothetical protein